MRGLKKVKRIHELKVERRYIVQQIKKWDAMTQSQKSMRLYLNDIMKLCHKLENIDCMIEYAKKGYDVKMQRVYLTDLFNDINIY